MAGDVMRSSPMSGERQGQVRVVFTPSGKRGRFPVGTPVLAAARSLGVDLDSVCGGRALCSRCQVMVSEGEFSKHNIVSRAASLSVQGEAEQKLQLRGTVADGHRLGCQATLQADVVIDVPAESQVHRHVVRKPDEAHDIRIDPVVRFYYLEVPAPVLAAPSGDLQRLQQTLKADWGLDVHGCAFGVLQDLQSVLRTGEWRVTVAVRNSNQIIAIWPGLKERPYGIAVDVGSATMAASLCDLTTGEVLASAGLMNPQIRFGEDLMSRVSYAMMNPEGEKVLTDTVRRAINELVTLVTRQAGVERVDVLELTLVGNPSMHHLVMGISPVELGVAPFTLASDAAMDLPAADIGIQVNRGAHVYALPCIAGHVGADTAAVLLAEAPFDLDAVSLIVDVGTNAEIVLGNRSRLLAASSPTGPAFEGAQISSGQRAAPGAIERVRIDPNTLEPRFKVIGCDLWSDDPAFSERASDIGVTGICGSGMIEVVAEMYLAGILDPDGTIRESADSGSPRIVADGPTWAYVLSEGSPGIRISQGDVRAIQLAKAALYAGVRLLMDRLGVGKVDRIRLAGAFGSHIDGKHAMVLGMIPDCDLDKVSSAGNAAGTGARIALLDRSSRALIEAQVRRIEKIETAAAEQFKEYFVAAMALPHQTDSFDELAKSVQLPGRQATRANQVYQPRGLPNS